LGDVFIDPSRPPLGALVVSFEQDPGVGELAGRGGAGRYEPLALFSFGLGQDKGIFLFHNG
jgi:hypothetical protein